MNEFQKGLSKNEIGAKCLTHNKKICRCGWEWGWHYGTKAERSKKKLKTRLKKLSTVL